MKQRYSIRPRREKNLAFSEDTCLEKERVQSKVTPRLELNWNGGGSRRRRLGWRLAWWGSTKKASHLLELKDASTPTSAPIETELLVRSPQQWGLRGRRTKWPDRQRKESSWRKKADHWWRERKVQGQNGSLQNTSTDLKRTFVILIDHASAPIRKEKIEANEQSKEGGQPKSVCGRWRDVRQSQKL